MKQKYCPKNNFKVIQNQTIAIASVATVITDILWNIYLNLCIFLQFYVTF